jgi:hypothetical protein
MLACSLCHLNLNSLDQKTDDIPRMMIQEFCCKNPYEKLIRYNNALQILLQVIFS